MLSCRLRSLLVADVARVPRASNWVITQDSYEDQPRWPVDGNQESEAPNAGSSSWQTCRQSDIFLPIRDHTMFHSQNEASSSR